MDFGEEWGVLGGGVGVVVKCYKWGLGGRGGRRVEMDCGEDYVRCACFLRVEGEHGYKFIIVVVSLVIDDYAGGGGSRSGR